MVVDGEGGDLLDELEKINRTVEQRWFKFTFEVYVLGARLGSLNIIGNVDKGDDMDGELAED